MASIPWPQRPDDQPSVQVAAAAAMLRRGGDPARVSAVTVVPLALVHLIAEHLSPYPAPGDPRDDTPRPDTHFVHEDRWNEVIEEFRQRQRSHRRRIRIMRIMVICWAADTVLGAVAGLAHLPGLAVAVLVASPLILAVLIGAAFALPRPFQRRNLRS